MKIFDQSIARLIIILCRIQYRKYRNPIFFIRGTEENEGEYLIYTQDKETAARMDKL